jgi:hypothetical protein
MLKPVARLAVAVLALIGVGFLVYASMPRRDPFERLDAPRRR